MELRFEVVIEFGVLTLIVLVLVLILILKSFQPTQRTGSITFVVILHKYFEFFHFVLQQLFMVFVVLIFLLLGRHPASVVVTPHQFPNRGAEKLTKALHSLHLFPAKDGHGIFSHGLYRQIISVKLIKPVLLHFHLPSQ